MSFLNAVNRSSKTPAGHGSTVARVKMELQWTVQQSSILSQIVNT